MSPRFTHNAFLTAELEGCVEFYERFCALRVVKRYGGGEATPVAWLAPQDAESPIFVIAEAPGMPAVDRSSDPVLRHFGFDLGSAEAVDEMFDRLCAAGLEAAPPRDWGPVAGYLTFVRDPDGRVVEFSAGQDVSPANWD